VVQTTAASQPLLLVHSGENYAWFPAIAGNFFSTPNSINNQLINNFGFRCKFKPLIFSGFRTICAKIGGTNLTSSYNFVFSSNNLRLDIYQGATQYSYSATDIIPFSANTLFYAQVSRNSTTGEIKFFISLDGITYTQLGATITGITGGLNNPTSALQVGGALGAFPFSGTINSIEIFKDDNFTTPTQFFNPNQYNAATSQTQWTSSTGEVWSVQTGTATTGYKGVLVDRTIVQSDGIDDSMTISGFSITQPETIYRAYSIYNITVSNGAYGSSTTLRGEQNAGATSRSRINAGTALTGTQNMLASIKYLSTELFNGASSSIRQNNSNEVIGNAGANNISSANFTLFSTVFSFGNILITDFIISKGADTNTEQTAMYNYIRSINGNSF
jgi:hypothetical protein